MSRRNRRKRNKSKSMISIITIASAIFAFVVVFIIILLCTGNTSKINDSKSSVSMASSTIYDTSSSKDIIYDISADDVSNVASIDRNDTHSSSDNSMSLDTDTEGTPINNTDISSSDNTDISSSDNTSISSNDNTENTSAVTTTVQQTETEYEYVIIPTTTVAKREPATISIVAVGDNLIHSQIFDSIKREDGSYDFSQIFDQNMINIMSSADLTIVNQETPSYGNGYGVSTYPNFNAPTESIDSLINILGADVLTLASNHSYDKDEIGIIGTLNYIHSNYPGVLTTGTFDSYEASEQIPIIEVKGVRIAVLNYTYDLNYPYEIPNPYEVNFLDDNEKVERDFAKAKEQADFIICYPHWGQEYHTNSDATQQIYAQYFADLGADLIIGSHPHVCQELSYVQSADGRSVPVYYSLGNFLSAQNYTPRTLGGMAKVELYVDEFGNVSVSKCDYDFTCTYYTIEDVNGEWIFGNFKNYMLRDFPVYLEGSSGVKWMSPEYTHQLYVDIARKFNPNWS